MPLCVSAAPGMLEQTQSPPLAQPTATMRRHRRRSSHHLLMSLPMRPVSTSPYIHPSYPTHRPRPVTPDDDQEAYTDMATVDSLMDDACGPILRSQSVRLNRETDGGAPLRPLDILAPCPKKAGGRIGSGWQRWMAAFPTTTTTTTNSSTTETESRQTGRMLARPLSFCFGEDLDLDGDLDEVGRRMASLQREFSNARQARVEAEAEAEALSPVVVDLALTASAQSSILDDLMRVSTPSTAPPPQQQPSLTSTISALESANRPKVTIPSHQERRGHRGPISAAGESAAMAELMGIFSNPGSSPTSSINEIPVLPPLPSLAELDDLQPTGLQVALPATTPALTAMLEAAIMDGSDSSSSSCGSSINNINDDTKMEMTQEPDQMIETTNNESFTVEVDEPPRKTRKIPPRLSVNTSITESNDNSSISPLSVSSLSSAMSIDHVSPVMPGVALPLDAPTVIAPITATEMEDEDMLARATTPTAIPSLTMLQPHLDDSVNPSDLGRSPIVRTTNPVPLDWSFVTTPRVPKSMMPIGPTDVADDDDSDLIDHMGGEIYNTNAPQPLETIVDDDDVGQTAAAAAATANFLNMAPPGRPSAPLNAASHAIYGANTNSGGVPPAGYQRPRSFSVSVASARTATMNRLGLRRL
ncbi:hypothetical protein BDF19DRAFT_421833 [Syncephalis fuscata]|nr:hypothetical protein BDF19DRAFT_421833 [Syncephalis fuscata]